MEKRRSAGGCPAVGRGRQPAARTICHALECPARGRGIPHRRTDPGLAHWDIAALPVIVEETGGRATNVNGERTIHSGSLVTSNGLLHEAVITAISA